jgi:hypothetical protein
MELLPYGSYIEFWTQREPPFKLNTIAAAKRWHKERADPSHPKGKRMSYKEDGSEAGLVEVLGVPKKDVAFRDTYRQAEHGGTNVLDKTKRPTEKDTVAMREKMMLDDELDLSAQSFVDWPLAGSRTLFRKHP